MKSRFWMAAAAVVLVAVLVGVWFGLSPAPHEHRLERMTDEQGEVYFACPMHLQVRLPEPGNCPICGMPLVRREALPGGDAAASRAPGEPKVLYWYDPMRPDVHFDLPGKSPFMDMDLVPKYAEEQPQGSALSVTIDPQMVQTLGMRVAPVRTGTLRQQLRAAGSVAVDEQRLVVVESRTSGWIESLAVRAEGDPVRQGQRVATVYAPELLAADRELDLARQQGDPELVRAAETRLRLLGGTAGAGSRTPVLAPVAGFVIELLQREGGQVGPGMPLMKLADLDRLWIVAEIPEGTADWIAVGNKVEVQLPALPGEKRTGTVDYVYPVVAGQTRTLRARMTVDNPGGVLKPGIYADLTISGTGGRETLLVPSEAVIRTGTRVVVLVAEGQGRFRPVEVVAGPEQDEETAILSGLEPGEQVVVSGQFLIDSEASIRGAYRRMTSGTTDSESPAARMRNMGGETAPGAYEARPAEPADRDR